jgi:UDP-N-acetylglucosamine-lysosomal-enzyme
VPPTSPAPTTAVAGRGGPGRTSTEVDPNGPFSGNLSDSKGGANRYRDNEELRYSLRSIYTYAPWVRHIYIVTNGQVPHWLNARHPRLTVVPHSEIFKNKSHLPVFSSPAIEVHLHQIPGMADRFLYFNDDVMLGNEIWPDDFFTHSGGHKIFHAWNVPDCAQGCPDSWLADGYCDVACNKPECNFDEGDCIRNGTRINSTDPRNTYAGGGSSTTTANKYCSAGCPNTWLGDKVCDRSCKNVDCGYDAGDCGEELTRELRGYSANFSTLLYNVTSESQPVDLLEIDSKETAFYVDMKDIFLTDGRIEDALQDDDPKWIRAAVIRQVEKMIVVVLGPMETNSAVTHCDFEIVGKRGNSTDTVRYVFRVSRLQTETEPPTTPAITELIETPDTPLPSSSPNSAEDVAQGLRSRQLFGVDISSITEVDELLEAVQESVVVEGIEQSNFVPVRKKRVSANGTNELEVENSNAEEIQQLKAKEAVLNAENELMRFVERQLEQTAKATGEVLWPWKREEVSNFTDFIAQTLAPNKPIQVGRKLLDEFADSLRFVSSLYNRYFGKLSRKVIAHMPFMIDKSIMEELQSTFPAEFDATSTHRFRHSRDMQFAFAYYYYIVQARKTFDFPKFFREEMDLDKDGYLSTTELNAMSRVLSKDQFSLLQKELFDCFSSDKDATEQYVVVTEKTMQQCPKVIEILQRFVVSQKKFKHQDGERDQVIFYMVRDNITHVTKRLDEVLHERKKFICLNDNMNNPSEKLVETLRDFYEKYYPNRSPFELPEGERNPSLYLDELKEIWSRDQRNVFGMAIVALSIIGLVIFFLWRSGKLKQIPLSPSSRHRE